jgi:DNA mismatch endonuclease Vsr
MTRKSEPWPDVPATRRHIMAAIRGKDTKPELLVRRLLHAAGYRYRVHYRVFNVRPDIVFSARKKAIFVHGCFWHGHPNCSSNRTPATRSGYWSEKLAANRARDKRNQSELERGGWDFLVLWECDLGERKNLLAKLRAFLGSPIGS